MATVVAHIMVVVILLDFIRHYILSKKDLPKYLLVIGGLAGAFPDIDVPISWIYNLFTGLNADFHGLVTHSLIFPLLFFIFGLVFQYKKNVKWAKIFYIVSFSWFLHLLLDCLFGGYSGYLWPISINTGCICVKIWKMWQYPHFIDGIFLAIWLMHGQIYSYFKQNLKKS